jgi:tRNA threonylcarbamoyladenosine biosynthesis protein TsaB
MKLLALDASTDWLSVAAGDGPRWHAAAEPAGRQHSQRLLPLVESVLDQAGWRLRDLDGIAFGAGPGSFTGVRIACGVAQGLALGAGLPVVPVCTLEALAQAAWEAQKRTHVLVVQDARMQEVYTAAYQHLGGHEDMDWEVINVPAVITPQDVRIPAGGPWAVVGDAFARYPDLAAQLRVVPILPDLRPSAQAIGALALPRFAAGEGVAARDAMPFYVRDRVALTAAERAAGARL